ncbi:uncharacterized protein LOC141900100 isoform X2 [Tubulanus polymorphus]|uniref:uncharacterized protein LOC141900100 isoform X2 n=1 Tax=Tubulanus polymorphus TaxID=672921 RepID=UPI003DA4FACB
MLPEDRNNLNLTPVKTVSSVITKKKHGRSRDTGSSGQIWRYEEDIGLDEFEGRSDVTSCCIRDEFKGYRTQDGPETDSEIITCATTSDSGVEATPSDEDHNYYVVSKSADLEATPSDKDRTYNAVSQSPNLGATPSGRDENYLMRLEEIGSPARARSHRKSRKPIKSADKSDPNFRGVTVKFNTTIGDDRTKLIIESSFSLNRLSKRRRNQLRRRRSYEEEDELMTSSDSEEQTISMRHSWSLKSGKQCASCCTKKTPLWRDAEDGTPLCNACGIRYKKYRIRCVCCWFVPRKASKAKSLCAKCGQKFLISTKRL